MARSKTVPDEQVLGNLLELLVMTGPSGLTFDKASQACGLSPSTLVQRFGDRRRLVRAVLSYAWDRLDTETALADAEAADTPEGAIDLLARLSGETTGRNAADGLLLLREDILDPELRARGSAWGERLAEALGRRLSDDARQAQLLGWQMACLWQGAQIWWAFAEGGSAEQAIRQCLAEWLNSLKK